MRRFASRAGRRQGAAEGCTTACVRGGGGLSARRRVAPRASGAGDVTSAMNSRAASHASHGSGVALAAIISLLALSGCAKEPSESDASTVSAARQSEPIAPQPVEFALEGMHCEGCVAAIAARIKEIEGVDPESVKVSLEEHLARCVVSRSGSSDEIVSAVKRMGYGVERK